MSLIIATGSNVGESIHELNLAQEKLSEHFVFIAKSRIYQSEPVDYLDQPHFFNQVLEFEIPTEITPEQALRICKTIEKEMGRKKIIPKGPRNIDIDIIFWNLDQIDTSELSIPHPSWNTRSFVALPLRELPFSKEIEKNFKIPSKFNNSAFPID